MESAKHPPFIPILITGVIMTLAGTAGLVFLVLNTDPDLVPRWLFFFCLTLAACGLSLPVVAFLNRRFPTTPYANEGVLLRQTVWVGIYVSLVAWLQFGRILNLALAVFLAVSLALIESLLRLNEHSRFAPGEESDGE